MINTLFKINFKTRDQIGSPYSTNISFPEAVLIIHKQVSQVLVTIFFLSDLVE
jgi:hypothetical protein